MIIEAILAPIIFLVKTLLGLLPALLTLPSWVVNAVDLLSFGLMFFPLDVWSIVFANVVFWYVALYSWSIIEWVYKKIPGVN